MSWGGVYLLLTAWSPAWWCLADLRGPHAASDYFDMSSLAWWQVAITLLAFLLSTAGTAALISMDRREAESRRRIVELEGLLRCTGR